jgi:DNA-binding transcriptional regulator YiaG
MHESHMPAKKKTVTARQLAKLLREWRDRNEYSQSGASDALGISKRTFENWEQERAMPQGFALQALLEIISGRKGKR